MYMQSDDPRLATLMQQQQLGQSLQMQQDNSGRGDWASALAAVLRVVAGSRMANKAAQGIQDYNDQRTQQANDLMTAYGQASQGSPAATSPAVTDDSGNTLAAEKPMAPAVAADPNKARDLLTQAMMSNDPRMQKWAAITMSQAPQNRSLTDSQIASNLEQSDYTPGSWSKFMKSRNMADLEEAPDYTPDTSGHWGKSPSGADVWMGPKGSVQFAPQAPSAGTGAPNMQVDPKTGLSFYLDAKGNPHFPGGQMPDQNRADEANTMLQTLNHTGNMVATLPTPTGLGGRVAEGMEKVGDLLGDDDSSRQSLENNIFMLRQGMVNQLTGGHRQPNKLEQGQVDQILPLYNPLTSRVGLLSSLKNAEDWINTRNSGSLWRSQGRPGFTPPPQAGAAQAPAAPGAIPVEDWLGKD